MIKYLLLPFAVLYNLVTKIRNWLFDKNILKSIDFDIASIGVGNLSVGGSGKSPMIEYLIEMLIDDYNVVTLSRGYKRVTKGYLMATEDTAVEEIGDEPSQFHYKYRNKINVAVGEDRALAIPHILSEKPDTNMILLDDIYQHRHVKPKLLILLTTYQSPFYKDALLPMGRLRESRKGAKRADVIVVTKCPSSLSLNEKEIIRNRISEFCADTPVFFSEIKYREPVIDAQRGDSEKANGKNVVLVSGLANADLFESYASSKYNVLKHFRYKDHHHYAEKEVSAIKDYVSNTHGEKPLLLTTEKDIVKLRLFDWEGVTLIYLPIEVVFQENEDRFKDYILSRI